MGKTEILEGNSFSDFLGHQNWKEQSSHNIILRGNCIHIFYVNLFTKFYWVFYSLYSCGLLLEDCCSILFTNFAPENILALLLTRLNQNLLTLLPSHLLAALLGHIKTHLQQIIKYQGPHSDSTHLSGHVFTDGCRDSLRHFCADLFGYSFTFLVLDLDNTVIRLLGWLGWWRWLKNWWLP